ncbi:MAG: response regulator [Bacteroidota bacterium]|nr:response regulator [Bacteroidota bacterium]
MIDNSAIQFKILIVDDNSNNIQVLGSILRDAKYIVGFANNGHQAIEILNNTKDYDLVLLDVSMPEMDGFEICKTIQQDKELRNIPVIFITVYNEIENVLKGFNIGARDYITKPFNSRELLSRIKTHIKLKHKSDQIKYMNQMLREKNKGMSDSIVYASKIQEAMMPSIEILKEKFIDCFIYEKPKDIVSGDFYWFKEYKNYTYLAVADCTGHGVPGALMSILGISQLNEIVRDKLDSAGKMLDSLRDRIKSTLNQNNKIPDRDDGMDMSLCLINETKTHMQFSGAYTSLFLFSKNENGGSYDFHEYRGDQMPIGIHPNDNNNFMNYDIDIKEGDILYLFSDGYISQFGGDKNKKFLVKRFKDLLTSIIEMPMTEQKKILDKTLTEWQGTNEQTDDVLVVGIKI